MSGRGRTRLSKLIHKTFDFSSYPTARYVGYYKIGEPALIIRDLELVKEILVTKFNAFNMNDFACDPEVNREAFGILRILK